jgi:beta-lactamase class D
MLLDLQGGPIQVVQTQPCDQPTVPASTFKVPHALIALDTGVVTDPEALVPWDGREYWLDSWNRDHSLRTAIYHSVVWFFQGTARAIGRDRMREYLEALDYGNARVEEPIDRFWLDDGSLRITPEQQLRFWEGLYRGRLPRGAEHVPTLRALLVRPPASFSGRVPEGTTMPQVHEQLVMSAKTGTAGHEGGSVTWLVGHVACPGREYVFVSRVIADEPPGSISPAVEHGLDALDRLGVLRCEVR